MFEAGQIIAGVVIGYLVVSICESYFHRNTGHPSARFRKLCQNMRIFGSYIAQRRYAHLIHHFATYRENHVTQFTSAEEEARLRRKLAAAGKENMTAHDYGLRVGGSPHEFFLYVAPTLPFMALVFWLGGGWFSLGAVVPLIVMPFMSELIHPLLHLTYDEAREAASPFLKPLVATRYFRYLARHHWVHHQQSDVNFNLMLGGDYIFGCHRTPTRGELAEMAAMGLSVSGCGEQVSER